MKSRTTRTALALILVAAGIFAVIDWNRGPNGLLAGLRGGSHGGEKNGPGKNGSEARLPHVEIVDGQPDTIRFSKDSFETLGIHTVEVESAPPPDPLRLN